MIEKRTPEIRFKGYTQDWEQRKFETVIRTIQTGTNLLGSESNYGTPLIKMGNIQRGYFIFTKTEYLNENDNVEEKNMVKFGDFLFNTRNTLELVGKGATWFGKDDEFAFNSNIARFTFKGIDTIFFNYLYNTPQMIKQVQARAVGTTSVAAVYPRDLNSMKFELPIIIEQQKIGSFFKLLDNAIALHQDKLEKLKQLKKGYLQVMFPQKGEKTPSLRFAHFSSDWEQRKMEEVAQLTMGQSPKSENYTDNPKDYILVQGNADMKNGKVVPRVWTTQITKRAEKDDLILSVRAPVGDIGKTDYDVVLGRGVAAVKGNEFLFQLLGKMKLDKYWTKLSTGSTFESINSKDIQEAIITLPSKDEQQIIGCFFKQLDHTIALNQDKLEKIKQVKEVYLQKLFI